MKDILKRLFIDNGYNCHYSDEKIYVLKHRDYDDFWIIRNYSKNLQYEQYDNLSFVTEQVFHEHKTVEKNISMIITMKVSSITNKTNQTIIELEDDPFCFKKYVIHYADIDLQELEPMIDPVTIAPNTITDIIMDRMSFSDLKNEIVDFKQRVGKFHLLYMLAHKLPFLLMNVTRQSAESLTNHFTPSTQLQKDTYDWAINVKLDNIKTELEAKYNKKD